MTAPNSPTEDTSANEASESSPDTGEDPPAVFPTPPVIQGTFDVLASIAENDSEGVEIQEEGQQTTKPIRLYKSTRLKGYMTLLLSSVIHLNAAQKSEDVLSKTAVPATARQRRGAVAVSAVSIVLSGATLLAHLDRFTPLEQIWVAAFKPKSRFELGLSIFHVLWWSISVGFETSVGGIAGDGKGQYSLYYSAWVCCLTTYWILERWWVACNWSSFKAFITSWPNRAPGWLCIMFLSLFTLIWYLDLWRNRDELGERESEETVAETFEAIPKSQWRWLVVLTIFTFIPATAFVLAEIFRETKSDGSNEEKSRAEIIAEGAILGVLVLAWIPAIVVGTSPGGLAALIGNAYFFSCKKMEQPTRWFGDPMTHKFCSYVGLLVIFLSETAVWYVSGQGDANGYFTFQLSSHLLLFCTAGLSTICDNRFTNPSAREMLNTMRSRNKFWSKQETFRGKRLAAMTSIQSTRLLIFQNHRIGRGCSLSDYKLPIKLFKGLFLVLTLCPAPSGCVM